METIKNLCTAKDMDLISALPDNLMETILIKLPLRDAVRTCILSRRWRYSWVKLPHLEFDAAFWQQSLQISQYRVAKFALVLFRILVRHQGQITSIRLHIPELGSAPGEHYFHASLFTSLFIKFIFGNGVKKCVLTTFPGGYYKLSSCLFTCPSLTDLFLRTCEVDSHPTTLERCSNLTSITLDDVTISAQTLASLVSSCGSLEILILNISIDISCLEINAPKLVQFAYSNSHQCSLALNSGQRHQAILNLLGGFPHLSSLDLNCHCVKYLVAVGFPTKLLSGIFHSLKVISLFNTCVEDVDQFLFILCLIRSSPNLHKLKVHQTRHTVYNANYLENLREEELYSDLTLNRLEEVQMLSVFGGRLELEFIRILFAKSPSLRKINIYLGPSTIVWKLKTMKKICAFLRAAPNVGIHIEY